MTALAQTADGYLWLGTTDGLLRFDGSSFEQYQAENGSLSSRSVSTLLVVPDGLWVGFSAGGASFISGGRVTNYSDADGFPVSMVRCFARDPAGAIWAAVVGGFARLQGHRWQKIRHDWNYSAKTAWRLLVDRDGTLWVATGTQIVFLPDGEKRFQSTGIRAGKVSLLTQAPGGTIFFYDDQLKKLRACRRNREKKIELLPDIDVRANSALFDRDGALWLGGDGVSRIPYPDRLRTQGSKQAVESFTEAMGLSNDSVAAILEDREGNIWVGTDGGLDRFRYRNVSWFPLRGSSFSLVAGAHGDVWAGSRGDVPLVRVQDRKLAVGGPTDVFAVYHDPDGSLWYGANSSLLHWQNGRFAKIAVPREVFELSRSVKPPDPIIASSITKDRSGNLWVAFGGSGEFRFKSGTWTFVPILPDHPDWTASYAFADSADRVWLAWSDRIACYDHGDVQVFAGKDGLAIGPPRVIAEEDQHIWAGGESGLSLLRGGRFHTIQTADAPGFTSVSGIVAVPNGGLWLTTGSGIAHIPDGEIENVIQQPEHKVAFELFDLVSDLPEPLQRGQVYSPGAVQASDGTIWFATQKGAVRVDPTHIYRNLLPPPVSIRSIVADEKSYSPFSNAALPALTKNLRIEYAALSLSIPERVRFRYKLEGFDNAWHEAGNRREVFFTNLGPAKYSFRLIACNNDGVWNELGTTLNLSVAPAWFQTTWFRAFCAGVVLLLACILYQWRVRQLHRQQKELRDVIDTVPANVWSTSPDGAVDFVNRRSLEYLHVPAANLLGWNWEAAVHPDDLARFVSHWRAALKRGEPMEHEVRLRRGDGAYRWWITRNVPLRDKSGNIVKWYGSGFDIEDRKRAQETLRDQADLLNLTNDAIFVRDMDLTIKYWNRGAEMLYGWTAAEAEGKSSRELLKTEFPEPIEQIKAELLSQGRWEGELVRLTKEGTRVVVSSRWSLQRDEHGAPIGILETNNDITDRKRAESLLAGEKRILEMVASEDSLGEILSALCQLAEEHASDALASILLLEGDRLRHGGAAGLPKAYADAIDGAPIGPSAASCGTAAYRHEQVIVADIATDPLWANYRDLALSHGLRACWSTPIFSPQRKVIATFALYYREPRSPRQRDQEIIGQITHLASVAIERKLTQEALRRNEAYLAEAQRVAHVGSWVWEVDGGNHLHLSEEGYRLVGFDLHASGLTWEQRMHRVHPEDRARWQAGIERAIAEKSDYDLEFRILLPSGAVRYIRSVGHPVLDSSGKLVQFIGVSMDLTERRRGEEERERLRQELTHLAHLNRVSTLGELTASLAHEIRQPITAAVTNARTSLRWLQREPPEIQEACEAAIRVVSDVNRAADIINRLRSLYQKGSVERELVDVNEVAREMLALLSSEAQRYSISMRTELAAELPKIQADRVQLQQVFMNLMVNSIEAMKDTGGELTIRSERGANGEVLISIKDTGVGLPTENVGQIFSAFYTTKSHGTGMGLSISRTIIESHGGRLWASGCKGQGATFQFTLPAEAESSSPAG